MAARLIERLNSPVSPAFLTAIALYMVDAHVPTVLRVLVADVAEACRGSIE